MAAQLGLTRIAFATLAAVLVVSCGSPKPSTIDNPQVVLLKVTERLFTVRTVHLKVNLAEAGGLIGGPDSAQAEGDFDIPAGELAVKGRSSELAAAPIEFVIDDGVLYTRTTGPWTNEPAAGVVAALPTADAVRAGLRSVAGDARVGVRLDAIAACPTGECYTLILAIPGAVGWDLVAPMVLTLRGDGPAPDEPPVAPPDVPATSIRVYADVETFDLVQLELIIDDRGGRIRLVVDATNHDAPIRIDPPRN